ncbi:NLRC3, partial [Symbiodinium necroappetens]
VYELDKPEALAQFLQDADIRLVRAEYFLKLLQEKRPLKRRQEAEVPSETCSSLNHGVCSALVPHEEVQEWAQGRQHALIVSISHAWETREHPDPCRFQLQQIWNAVGLYAAANRAVWVFYDYMSLFQFKRQTEAQNESFRRSMNAMHMLYAHDSTHTFRIESLTPQDVWNTMLDESVPVYREETSAVEPRPLRCLTPNSNPYLQRGWCMAEIEWSSTRSDSSMHQRIGPGSEGAEHPGGRVPMAPDLFREQMHQAVFTHRSDVESVIRLQEKIFFQKVTVCKELTLSWLVPDQLSALA